MVLLRKAKAGSDSFGNQWHEDGSVVDVPLEQATELLRIKDAGFNEVAPMPDESLAESPAPVQRPKARPRRLPTMGIDPSLFTEE